MLRDIAKQVYQSEMNQKLLHFLAQQRNGHDPDPEDEQYQQIMKELRQKLQQMTEERLDKDKDNCLVRVAEQFLGLGKQADVWLVMIDMLPYDLSLKSLPDNQIWIVDGPIVGDGLCHEKCCSGAL